MNNKGYPLLKAFRALGLSRSTAYRWVRLGKVKVARFPGPRGRIVISEEELGELRRVASGKTDNP